MQNFNKVVLLLFITLIVLSNKGNAQVTNYTFTPSSGIFVPLSGATTVSLSGGSLNEGWYNNIPIGFGYFYIGTYYTSVSASTNGWLTMGNVISASAASNDLSANGTRPLLAPLWDDLDMASGTVSYLTTGTAPNRVFTLQWLNAEWDWLANTPVISFQVKLYETTGTIQFVYRQEAGGISNASASIGITAPSSGLSSFISLGSAGSSPSVSSTASTNNINTKPTNGQIYSFACVMPTASPTTLLFLANSNQINLYWTDNSSNEIGFAIFMSTDGVNYSYTTTVPANSITSLQIGLSASTLYYWKVYAITNGGVSNAASGSQSTSAGASGVITVPGNYPTITSAITALKTYGISGHVIIELQDNYFSTGETFPIRIPGQLSTSATKTLTIRPAASVSSIKTIATTYAEAIQIDSGKYIKIDGRPGGVGTTKMLQINGYGSPAIKIFNAAAYDTIRYCILTGTTNSRVVSFETNYSSLTIVNCSIENCEIKGQSTYAAVLIHSGSKTRGINISNNNLYDFYSSGFGATAVYFSDASACTIVNNHIYQTQSISGSIGTTQFGISINSNATDTTGFTITGNYIGGQAPFAGGGAYSYGPVSLQNDFVGIYLKSPYCGVSNIQNNTVGNIVLATTVTFPQPRGSFSGIFVEAGSANVAGNTIGSATANNSIYVLSEGVINTLNYGIRHTGSGTVSNNIIAGITVDGSGPNNPNSFTGIYAPDITVTGNRIGSLTLSNNINAVNAGNSSAGQFLKGIVSNSSSITNNIISNLNNNYSGTSASGVTRGIESSSAVSSDISGNIIKNIAAATANTSLGINAAIIGISQNASTYGQIISQNMIDSLVATHSSANVCVSGIYCSCSNLAGNFINGNFIHSLSLNTSSASAIINGIQLVAGNIDVTNNMIRLGVNALGNSTNACQIVGIDKSSNGDVNLFFNSIYIGGSNIGTNLANTWCYKRNAIGADAVYNNIFYNARSNATTGGKHYAIGINSAGSLLSNNNIMLSQTSPFGVVSGTDYSTFYSYRNATMLDTNSGCVNPNFVNPGGTASNVNLHVGGTTPVESNGRNIGTVTLDFDGQTRSALSPVDIGADAGLFTWAALPVTWLSVNAAWGLDQKSVILSWACANEINNSGFEIERSADGVHFEYVAFVQGAVNSSTATSYQFVDQLNTTSVESQTFYYRIKQIDKDGVFSYSEVKVLSKKAEAGSFNVYPNPFTGIVKLHIENVHASEVLVTIHDITGKSFFEKTIIPVNKLIDDVMIAETTDWPAGIYIMQLTNGEETRHVRLVKSQ